MENCGYLKRQQPLLEMYLEDCRISSGGLSAVNSNGKHLACDMVNSGLTQ